MEEEDYGLFVTKGMCLDLMIRACEPMTNKNDDAFRWNCLPKN